MKKQIMGLVLLVCACFAQAGVYKWVDANGKVHYGDQPPIKQKKVIKVKAGGGHQSVQQASAAEGASASQTAATPTPAHEQQQEEQKKQEKVKNCLNAQNNLKALKSGGKVVKYNSAGQTPPLDAQQKADELERAKRAMDIWCK